MQDQQRVARAELGTFVRWIGLCALSTSAIAAPHDPGMSMGAVSVPDSVTVSTSSTQQTPSTNVAYLITFDNSGGSDVTSTLLSGTLSFTTGLTGAVIQDSTVNPALPSQCSVTATTLSCDFGTVAAGVTINFPLIVKAPQYTAAPVPNQSLTLSLTSTHREGNSTTGNSITTLTATVVTPVAAQSTTSMKSVVVKSGGQFFTGGNGIPQTTDVYTSAVDFQAFTSKTYSLVTITEDPLPPTDAKCIGGKHFKTCYMTKLYAPDVTYASGFLTETIRVHPDNFRPGAANKMGTVIWEYTATDASGNPTGTPTVVGQCASPTSPRSDGIPCQVSFVCYTSDKVPGWTPELDQTCAFTFINIKNGFQRGY